MEREDRSLTTSDLAPGDTADTEGTAQLTGRSAAGADGGAQALLAEDDVARFRGRWEEIQTGFVDDPRGSVEHADALVAEVMQHLAASFSQMRSDLETQWSGGGDAGTEDLRIALRRYRTFFELLLRR